MFLCRRIRFLHPFFRLGNLTLLEYCIWSLCSVNYKIRKINKRKLYCQESYLRLQDLMWFFLKESAFFGDCISSYLRTLKIRTLIFWVKRTGKMSCQIFLLKSVFSLMATFTWKIISLLKEFYTRYCRTKISVENLKDIFFLSRYLP